MKIAQIMASDGEGGLEKHFIELCNGLSAQGHQVFALCLPKYKDRLSSNVQFISFDLTGSRKNPITIFKLLNILKKINADIVHAQANKAAQMLSPCLNRLTSKSVVTIHNKKNKLKFLANFDLCVGVSKGVTKHFPNTKRATVIYNGITPPEPGDKLAPLPRKLPPRKNVLSIGRLVPAKGFDLLVRAAKTIDANILIAGDGPDKEQLQQMIENESLTDKVFLLGHRDDIPSLINQADLIAISSRKEGFSYVFAEALLLGKPVVSTDVPIPNEVLPDAWIADINENDIANKLKSAINKLDTLDEFEAIFDYASKHLTFDMQLRKTVQAYEGILTC